MFSLNISLFGIFFLLQLIENKNLFFTQLNYHLWYQENLLFNTKFLYPDPIINGIERNSNIQSVLYHFISNNHHDLFEIQTKQIGNAYFFILNITRPFDINREYQDYYLLNIQANITTNQGNITEQAKIHLHIADSNDNDVVFDEDIYEKTISELTDLPQLLFDFHASDADENHHAQILYEFSSSFNQTFTLHPFTGEFYLISNENLQEYYQFDIYAYDRYRVDCFPNNIKTKAQVKLKFLRNKPCFQFQTISNQTIVFEQLVSSYNIRYQQRTNWNLLNIHQEILRIDIVSSFEIFILNNSSKNSRNLFLYENKFYLKTHLYDEYNLQLLICFSNRSKCQLTNYLLKPTINWNLSEFTFQHSQSISFDDDLPIYSYLTTIQMTNPFNDQLIINFKLLNYQEQFHLHPKTGILRLIQPFKLQIYHLNIQADLFLYTEFSSLKTSLEIHINEINKYRPIVSNQTFNEYLPYQFHVEDFDRNKQTNGRISYYLSNCSIYCPFEIHPLTGLLTVEKSNDSIEKNVYDLQISVYDWGEPIHFESKLDIQIDLSRKSLRQKQQSSFLRQTIQLNIGFPENSLTYHLSEDTEIYTIIDYLQIVHRSFPLFINNDKDNLFFYIINDTSVPFDVNQKTKALQLIHFLDREKQEKYTFEIHLQLKAIYRNKLEEFAESIQFSNRFYQKLIVTIYINDINDNLPTCRDFHQHIYLNENQIHINFFRIQANDLDLGENGTIHYSLLNYSQYFMINSFTGQIDLYQPIDHEQISSLHLYVLTSDQGQSIQLQSLCMTIHITIIDLNDNIPQFVQTKYLFEIFADLPNESLFGQIYANDRDAIDQLSYSIENNPYVDINERTGYLRLKSSIDQNRNFTVQVTDGLYINQTSISIRIKHFLQAQQPILLNKPAWEMQINRSISIGTIITNIYQYLNISSSSIDYIEILSEENSSLFSIDQQGFLRLIHSLINQSNSFFWISIRLTRYRAHPAHCYFHIYFFIQEDNFYYPQCQTIYQNLKFYEYSITYPLTRIQGLSTYDHIQLEYLIKSNQINEHFFSIDHHTGFLQLLPSIKISDLNQSNYFLTIEVHDREHFLSVDCYLKMNFIQRKDLIPRFIYSTIYNLDLVEIPSNSPYLRQRLFQVVALLDDQVYHKNLQIRYRLIDTNEHFIINPQTGYIAAKKPLKPQTIYRFHVEAFTVVYRGKWRVVSPRIVLPIKIRILSLNDIHSSSSSSFLFAKDQSIIHFDLLITTKIRSNLIRFGMENNQTQWFILIGSIEYTKYFHINVQTGQLILIRPIDEFENATTLIELHVNITQNWRDFQTIKLLIHIRSDKSQMPYFPQTDYYSSISKTLPLGTEIARLTIANPYENCSYEIHSIERLQSKDIFYLNSSSSSLITLQSLDNSLYEKHRLTIIYLCPRMAYVTSTNLYVNILEKKDETLETFPKKKYLIVFESSLKKNQRKYLMNFQIENQNLQIIDGDPFDLFAIDSTNQSLYLVDESLSRSYIYPIQLTILDTSSSPKESLTFIVTIFISNIAIQLTCSMTISPSPFLFTYQSQPKDSLDWFTGQEYSHWNSTVIRGFDFYSPSISAECSVHNSKMSLLNHENDFHFEKDMYSTSQPIIVSIKNRKNFTNPFDITYQSLNRNLLQLDKYTGLIDSFLLTNLSHTSSFLILAKYQSLITLTRLKVNSIKLRFYKFRIYKPLIENYTIGYIEKEIQISDEKLFSIDRTGRLFIKNSSLDEGVYSFNLSNLHLEISVYSKESIQCWLNRLNNYNDKQIIGFIQTNNRLRKTSFSLLNYHHQFQVDYQYGLLIHRNRNQIIDNELLLLIEIENARCILKVSPVSYQMIRKGSSFDLVPTYAPRFARRLYTFSLDLTNNPNEKLFVGQILAQPYNRNRSSLVYEFVFLIENFLVHPENGIIEYLPNRSLNQTRVYLQIIARDLIYQQNTKINVTIDILRSNFIPFDTLVYHRTVSRYLSPGSIIFQPNISNSENFQYDLRDSNTDIFMINSLTGNIRLRNFLSQSDYRLQIHLSPINQILILKLTVVDFNNHPPTILSLPFNLSISSDDTFVTKLSAYDLDFSDNSNLEYYLLDNQQQNIFSIQRKTGLITLKISSNQTFFPLKIGVTDSLHLTINYLSISIHNFSKNAPKFTLNEYIFQYHAHLGQIFASDADPNDQLIYELYLQPDGILIDQYSGFIRIEKHLFPQTIEFYASATDRAKQIVYTKIKILFPIQPKFSSNLYHISLNTSLKIPLEIFQFQLVNQFNRPLSSTRFEIDQKDSFEIQENRLILKHLFSQRIIYVNVMGFWRNFSCQTSIRITIEEKRIKLNKKFYEFSIDKHSPSLIKRFDINNSSLKILSTPLTFNNCTENFHLKHNRLYLRTSSILSDICFFELQLTNESSISTSQVKILLIDSDSKPKFSSKIYDFYSNNIRVFAQSSNSIRYRLQTNSYGFLINPTNGIVFSKYNFQKFKHLNQIQLIVYAIDEQTNLNDTAMIHIRFQQKKEFQIPENIRLCSNKSKSISDQSLPGTIIHDLHEIENDSNRYYILEGDRYGLFAVNNFGKIYLFSSMLNQTSEEYFQLVILISSLSISYCQLNISIIRSLKWSNFLCPPISIEWTIEEESPVGTTIGNLKEILLKYNTNNSQLIDQIEMKFNSKSSVFYLNSSSGLIQSKSRLDYEQKPSYSLLILITPIELHCSIYLSIKLINIADNPIIFNQQSLIYNLSEHHLLPFRLGRIKLIDIDQIFSSKYRFYLKNFSSDISIDLTTGSIILLTKLNRKQLKYEIQAIDSINQRNLTDFLILNLPHRNQRQRLFDKDFYQLNLRKSLEPSTIIFQGFTHDNIEYSLRNSSSSSFSIDKLTGMIHLIDYLPSSITNLTLNIEAIDHEMNITDQMSIVISIQDDQDIYFQLNNILQCVIDERIMNKTIICTIGRETGEFKYELIDPMNQLKILENNGTIIKRNRLDKDLYNITVIVRNRKNPSIVLSSLNISIPNHQTSNKTTLLYLFYPSINTILYKIENTDLSQVNLTYQLLNDTFSSYKLHLTLELVLIKLILTNREDNLIIRFWRNQTILFDLNLRLIYHQSKLFYPTILSQTIDGYINFQGNSSHINLGRLAIENSSQYTFIHFHLNTNKHFYLKQISMNQTEIYFNPINQSTYIEFPIHLTAIALIESIPQIDFSKNVQIFFPNARKSQMISIHLWSIDREMLDRTISIILHIDSNITSEQFLIEKLPFLRQTIAEIIGVDVNDVHIYSFNFQNNQIELLLAILRSSSERFLHKKFVFNALQNTSHLFDRILFNQCQANTCENHGFCTSSIHLFNNQYDYFYSNIYQRLIPKYQWHTKCLCTKSYSGEYCQLKHDMSSSCSSNPCLPREICIEESATEYSCQCIDDLCEMKHSFKCLNSYSLTCRESSNIFTFNGYSRIRMNTSLKNSKTIKIRFTFRTYSTEGRLLKLISYENKTISIQIIDSFIKIIFDENLLLQLNERMINDGLWHDLEFFIDFIHDYYLFRLDQVFSERIVLSQRIDSNSSFQWIIGSEFHGCLGNFSINNQMISFENENENENHSMEFIGTTNGCELSEIIKDDLCSIYKPCYYGGECVNNEEFNFTCNCSQTRFTGRQCQIDLYPCASHPCSFDEQCISFSSNRSFTCAPLIISSKKSLFIGISLLVVLAVILIFLLCCCKKENDQFRMEKSLISGPLFINESLSSSSLPNQTDGTMQTLLKSDYNRNEIENHQQSLESMHRWNDRKYNPTTEEMSYLSQYTPIDYDNIISSSRTDFFDDSLIYDQRNPRLYINSMTDLTRAYRDNNDFHHPYTTRIPTSTVSLSKAPIYARIVKTPRVIDTMENRLNSLQTNDETDELVVNRLRHASDSDLLNGKKSTKFSSFFQTDV